MTDVDRWLDAYVAAWKSYDPEAIGDCSAEGVEYRYHPADEPSARARGGRQPGSRTTPTPGATSRASTTPPTRGRGRR